MSEDPNVSDEQAAADEQLETFWDRAAIKARINPFEVVLGPDRDSSLMPPTWSLDDAAVDQALKDKTIVLTSALEQHDELIEPGGFSILLRENGTPAALLQTTDVTVHSQDEMIGLADNGDWESVKDTVAPDSQIVVERFKVLVSDV
ncbi:MAG: hypothetical protein QMB98_02280 [Flaviflexus sp.]|uniref:hypothetical protein n=1 Tax=Flaviflexus sp. TaxID=1969482 RepID=UPI00352CF95D